MRRASVQTFSFSLVAGGSSIVCADAGFRALGMETRTEHDREYAEADSGRWHCMFFGDERLRGRFFYRTICRDFFLLCVGVRRTVLPQHTHVCLYQRRAHTHPVDSKAHLPASPSDADAARDVDFNGDGHGGDVHSDTGSGSGLAANIHPDDAPPAPGPSSRSDGAHARTQSLLASSTPPPPQNSICGSQPRPKPEPEPNFSTPPSIFKPTPPNKAAPKPKTKPSPYLAHARPDAIPELYDIPLGMVNRVVYGPRRTLGIQS